MTYTLIAKMIFCYGFAMLFETAKNRSYHAICKSISGQRGGMTVKMPSQ